MNKLQVALASLLFVVGLGVSESLAQFDGTSAGFQGVAGRVNARISNYRNGGIFQRQSEYVRYARTAQANTGYTAYSRNIRQVREREIQEMTRRRSLRTPTSLQTGLGAVSSRYQSALATPYRSPNSFTTGHSATFNFGSYRPSSAGR